jgi:DNA-binding transcriptional regulator YdaS (Cro superfamily)
MDLRTYLSKETTQTELAGKLGLTQGAISQWLRKRVPADRVLAIERATGGKVTRHELRPDLYPVEPRTKSKRH